MMSKKFKVVITGFEILFRTVNRTTTSIGADQDENVSLFNKMHTLYYVIKSAIAVAEMGSLEKKMRIYNQEKDLLELGVDEIVGIGNAAL